MVTKILILTGTPAVRRVLHESLSAAGFDHVRDVATFTEALSALREFDPSLVILGDEVDGADAWRLARLIRSGVMLNNPSLPILLATTSLAIRFVKATCAAFGIDDALHIGSQLSELPGRVQHLIAAQNGVMHRSSVLVVEDDEDTSELLRRILMGRYDVEVAMDGLAGLRAWEARRHDLVLLDVMMPKLSGLEVLRSILAQHNEQLAVVLTAHAELPLAQEAILLGAVDFAAKPLRAEYIRQICDSAFRQRDYLELHRDLRTLQSACVG